MSSTLTLVQALDEATQDLGRAGIGEARREARLLAAHVLEVTPEAVFREPGIRLRKEQAVSFRACVVERAARRPMAQILGRREFRSLSFRVTEETLDPRPDSETLIEAVLNTVSDRAAPLRILDLGTGTGCLLLALLHEFPDARGVGVDVSVDTLEVARDNAKALGLAGRSDFCAGDWGNGLGETFHVIISNPPYIPSAGIAALEPEVTRYEPRLALDGGQDGLACYRALLADIPRLLEPSGGLFVEVGIDQAESVGWLCVSHGLTVTGTARDLAGITRCVMARRRNGSKGTDRKQLLHRKKTWNAPPARLVCC